MNIPEGVIVAMLTPFDENGKVNEPEVRKLVSFLIEKGVDGIFPVSSCGEYVHMDMSERKFLIDIVVDEAKSRVDIIPGTGATCYHQSIELAEYAKQKGCSAVVLHGPYFFKNTEDVVEGHLKKVAESVNIPIFVYNIPFFANEVTPYIVERLAHFPNIVGIKDSSGNMINVMNLIEMTRKIKPDFKVLVGAEEIMLPALLMGARGCMTTTAGILPEFMTGIWNAFRNGNLNEAYNLQFAILPFIREMKSFNFPQGFKEALDLRGIKMGPPKMNYSKESLSYLSNLKERLKLEMQSLLDTYFSSTFLNYRGAGKESKYSYPEDIKEELKVKRYSDCILCGMCVSDNCIISKINETENTNKNLKDNFNLETIIKEVTRKVINEMNQS